MPQFGHRRTTALVADYSPGWMALAVAGERPLAQTFVGQRIDQVTEGIIVSRYTTDGGPGGSGRRAGLGPPRRDHHFFMAAWMGAPIAEGVPCQSWMIAGNLQPPGYQAQAVQPMPIFAAYCRNAST